jgi:hypothetical protein
MRTAVPLASLLLFAATPALAADPPRLSMFDDLGNQSGRWSIEMLDSSDPRMRQSLQATKGMSVCMDAAREMGRDMDRAAGAKCTTKVLRDTKSAAQFESACADGTRTQVTLTRESAKAVLFETAVTDPKGKPLTMKGRYHYEGPCKAGEAAIQLPGGNEKMCAQLKAMGASPEQACASAPAAQKAQCLEQMRATVEQMKRLCP